MKHKQGYKNRDGVKKYNTTNGGLIENLISVAIGAVIFLVMTAAVLAVYKQTTTTVEEIERAQTAETVDVEDLDAIIEELENIEK